jgi:hypothetical protein
MRRLTISLLLIVLLVSPATARVTGDPLDSNDGVVDLTFSLDHCVEMIRYSGCTICVERCLLHFICNAFSEDDLDWD